MAGIKAEVNPEPSPGAFPRLDSTHLDQGQTNAATMALFSNAVWKQNGSSNRLKQLGSKELAAKCALSSLNQFILTMNRHSALVPSAQARIDRIKAIIARKKDFQVLVGFLGSTGSGKTTIVNALLGIPHLLPCTTGRACTAVVVEVSYNKSSDPLAKFRAEVVYISKEEWSSELEQIFEDTNSEIAGREGENDEPDTERVERVRQTLDKLRAVYPHIKSIESLRSTTTFDLLNHNAVCEILGGTRSIELGSRSEFSQAIAKYVDSGNSSKKKFAQWPLVKLVKIYVKAPILENGITLVDLPGNSDSNAARSGVADTYIRKLSVTCIVANIIRGIDEKNAHDLLEKITKLNLQMDGLYNQESLCFILSQTDRDFEKPKYIKDNPELESACSVDIQSIGNDQKKLKNLDTEGKPYKASLSKLKKQVRDLANEIVDIIVPVSTGQKRRRISVNEIEERAAEANVPSELKPLLEQLMSKFSKAQGDAARSEAKLASIERRKGNIELAQYFTRSNIAAKCIAHRNNLSVAAIRKDFSKTLQEMGRDRVGDLQVFPVAATLYLSYSVQQSKRVAGFQTLADTKIPDLKDWLIGTTIPTRGKYAEAFLREVETFVDWMQPWVDDQFSDTKMTTQIRHHWEPQVVTAVHELSRKLSVLAKEATGNMHQILKTDLYSRVPKAERTAGAKAAETANIWAGLHWSTHKCANRGLGFWHDSKGADHKWNERLVHDLKAELLPVWTSTFTDELPKALLSYENEAKAHIVEFAKLLIGNPYRADINDALEATHEHILRTQQLHDHQSTEAFEEVKKAMLGSHREAVPAVKTFLTPMYEKCAMEQGRGHFQRNRTTHQIYFAKEGEAMHREGNKAVAKALTELLDTMSTKFKECNDTTTNQIMDEITQFFEQNSSDGNRSSGRRVVSNAKKTLSADLLSDIKDLATFWAKNDPVQVQAQSEDFDDNDEDIYDDRFVDVDKLRGKPRATDDDEDDEDYEDGSSGED
ncbi:hypothetical protein G7Y89_g10955 [Cudoniella acicularis]|uniref:Nuclear GTPase SLIP-GC n=1 Tax=Cudoniella acicularis TaxID=354080 RepID=A0A8H4RBS0_9HELO|nr:hypothetical protein G7Y89_g10955 [Cudoniella acicularis]